MSHLPVKLPLSSRRTTGCGSGNGTSRLIVAGRGYVSHDLIVASKCLWEMRIGSNYLIKRRVKAYLPTTIKECKCILTIWDRSV